MTRDSLPFMRSARISDLQEILTPPGNFGQMDVTHKVKIERRSLNGKSHITYQLCQLFWTRGSTHRSSWLAILALSPLNLLTLHYYPQNFKLLTSERNERSLLTGEGILIAAREMTTPQVQAI
jgi:hypothetical protein